jgi:hypothetical protein
MVRTSVDVRNEIGKPICLRKIVGAERRRQHACAHAAQPRLLRPVALPAAIAYTAAPVRLSRAVSVSRDLWFDGSRLVLHDGEFSHGDLDAKLLPLPKLIGDVLRRFGLMDRSTAT